MRGAGPHAGHLISFGLSEKRLPEPSEARICACLTFSNSTGPSRGGPCGGDALRRRVGLSRT